MRIADTAGLATLVALTAIGTATAVTDASWPSEEAQTAIAPAPVPPAPPAPPAPHEPSPRIGRCGVPQQHEVALEHYRGLLRRALRRCTVPDVMTEVHLTFVVAETGRVRKLDIKGRIDPELASCLGEVSNRLRFPVIDHSVALSVSIDRH